MQDPNFLDIIFYILVLVFSVVIHEVSHGYAALALGDRTALLSGRLSMNPLKHIDPMGSIIIPIVTAMSGFPFGWAKPVPYNPYNLRDQRWGDTKVALAGPFSNVLIALIFGLSIRYLSGMLQPSMVSLMLLIVQVNLVLAVFNMIPIPPLDGSKLLMNLLPYRYRYTIVYLERYALVFMVIFALYGWRLFSPVLNSLIHLFTGL